MKTLVLDTECYPNFFSVQFKNFETGKMLVFVKTKTQTPDLKLIGRLMSGAKTIGFNSQKYDLPMISALLMGFDNSSLKALSDDIIQNDLTPYQVFSKYGLIENNWNHIDIKDPSPGVMVSLKTYGGRLNAKKLQDLPYEPNEELTDRQIQEVIRYCENDLDTTYLLYQHVKPEIDLREEMSKFYNSDLRSKGGAQIAKFVFVNELGTKYLKNPPIEIHYKAPSWVKFNKLDWVLKLVEEQIYTLKSTGHVELPSAITKVIPFDGAKYKLGLGGLHSQEKGQTIYCQDDEVLQDIDVVSYYPSLILNLGLYPKHYGQKFLSVYQKYYTERLEAKSSGDKFTANSLKLVLNSSFGLFGNKYSPLYSPDLMIATTLTGQLALLMLIERLSINGIKTKSANTDGLLIHYPKNKAHFVKAIVSKWEKDTGLTMEYTDYRSIHMASVNGYIAIKKDGSVKTKGPFAETGLAKNPQMYICVRAVIQYLLNGTPIETTIRSETSVLDFLCVRNVAGGATWKNEYLGKVVRFYWSTDGDKIVYKKNGNKVPVSDNSTPLMEIGNLPNNIDYERYIQEAYLILGELNC